MVLAWLKGLSPKVGLTAYFLNFSLILPRMLSSLKAAMGLKMDFSTTMNSKDSGLGFITHNIPELFLSAFFFWSAFPPLSAFPMLAWWGMLYASPSLIQLAKK
jgi:hypothetical protein